MTELIYEKKLIRFRCVIARKYGLDLSAVFSVDFSVSSFDSLVNSLGIRLVNGVALCGGLAIIVG